MEVFVTRVSTEQRLYWLALPISAVPNAQNMDEHILLTA